jgi:hypothetical protein
VDDCSPPKEEEAPRDGEVGLRAVIFCGADATRWAPTAVEAAWPCTVWSESPAKWTSLIAIHGDRPAITKMRAPVTVWVND